MLACYVECVGAYSSRTSRCEISYIIIIYHNMLRGRIYDVRSVFSVDLTLYCCGVGGGRAQHGRGAGVFAARSRRQSRMVLGFGAK